MAVTATLHMRSGVTGDAREIRASEQWIVSTDPPSNADTSNPTGTAARSAGLPPLFTAGVFPNAPGLIGDSYESCVALDEQVGTKWLVTIRYSSNARFRFPPQKDRTNIPFQTIQDSSSRMILEVPYFSVVRATGTDIVPGTSGMKFVKGLTRLDLALANPQIRVNVNSFTAYDRSKIRAQLNKIHSFTSGDGPGVDPAEPARFVDYKVSEQADGLWTIVYSWIQDPGGPFGQYIPPTTSNLAPANGAALTSLNPGIDTLVVSEYRFPFNQYVVVPSTKTTIPKIIVVRQYTNADITGYPGLQALPGRPG